MERDLNTAEQQSGKVHCEFQWSREPKKWAGMDQVELEEMVELIANFYHIPVSAREKIKVIFGDQSTYTKNGITERPVAKYYPTYKNETDAKDDSLVRGDIILNRSRELLENKYGTIDPNRKLEDYDYKINDERLVVTLRNPWEGVVWLLAEEINHAAVHLKLNDENMLGKAEVNYQTYAQSFFKNDRNDGNSSYDVLEVTASRQVLRVLEKICIDKGLKDRAEFFRKMYEMSLDKRMVALPRTALILEEMYINTSTDSQQS